MGFGGQVTQVGANFVRGVYGVCLFELAHVRLFWVIVGGFRSAWLFVEVSGEFGHYGFSLVGHRRVALLGLAGCGWCVWVVSILR